MGTDKIGERQQDHPIAAPHEDKAAWQDGTSEAQKNPPALPSGSPKSGFHKSFSRYLSWRYLMIAVIVAVVAFSSVFLLVQLLESERRKGLLVKYTVPISFKESPEFMASLLEALEAFDNKQYTDARHRFLQLLRMAQSEEMRSKIREDLIIPTYTGAGEYEAGIRYICEILRDAPADDFRRRLDFQILISEIVKSKGFDAAEHLISRLRPNCERADLSYVWVGIPRPNAEHLHKEGMTLYEDGYKVPVAYMERLREIVKKYPNDRFLDYAHYFLHAFDKVIRDYPRSLILDVVYRAAGHRALQAGNYDGAIQYFETSARRWPRQPGWNALVTLLAEAYRKKGNPEAAIGWLWQLRTPKGSALAEFLGQKGPFQNAREVRAFLKKLRRYRPSNKFENFFDSRCSDEFDIANESLWNMDYEEALSEYEEVAGVFREFDMEVPSCIDGSVRLLRRIVNNDREPIGELFDLGFYLRERAAEDVGNPAITAAAAIAWEECAERSPGSEMAEKSLYLAAALWRRLEYYDEAAEIFRSLAKDYPGGDLADDALAEVGWYYLFIRNDHKLARRRFEDVLKKYSDRNAADNALNWLALSYYETGDYGKASQIYRRIVENYQIYPHGRLAKYASQRVKELEPVVKSERREPAIMGLYVGDGQVSPPGVNVIGAEERSDAEKAGLLPGDLITAVNGESIDSPELFLEELKAAKVGSTVTLAVMRSGNMELQIKVKVGSKTYYEILPNDR